MQVPFPWPTETVIRGRWPCLTSDEVRASPVVAECMRPDGYSGSWVKVRLRLVRERFVVEQHGECCWHICPVAQTVACAEHLDWLIDHSPAFLNYLRITPPPSVLV